MIRLRPNQQRWIDEIRAAFLHHRRVLGQAPTGFGKTVCFSYLARAVRAKGKRVYILVHRNELVEQVSRTLASFGVEHGIIASGYKPRACDVQVASVFTLANRLKDYPRPDMVIVDEGHHACVGSTWNKVFDHWSQAYILFVTATPARLDGKPLSFAETLVLGPTVAELMEMGDLSPYTLYAPPVAIEQLRMRMGDFARNETATAMDKPQLVGNAVEHYRQLAAGKRAVAFCVSLEHAANTAIAFDAAGFRSARIDGGLDKATRRKVVERFAKGDIQVLTSCDLISEGFDLPSIEVAILMRPTASTTLCLQQVGRALRPFPGKERAIILDHAGNTARHGLPDDDREWSLDGEDNGKSKSVKAGQFLRLCGRCYASVKGGAVVCPHCGWAWPEKPRAIKETDGELIEVSSDTKRVRSDESRHKAMQVGMAKSMDELLKIAQERGYKPSWALNVYRARQRKAEAA